MSKRVSQDSYEKTLSYRFTRWLNGEKDPLLGEVEMKPQVAENENDEKRAIRQERKRRFERLYDLSSNKEIKVFQHLYRIFGILFCVFLVFMLLVAVSFLPTFGDAENPVNNEVSARYLEKGLEETGAINFVTGMILDYRAFDTLGESHVLFIATCTVLILLRKDRRYDVNGQDMEKSDRLYEPKNDLILQSAARILVPIIAIFGIYVILCGHLGPGGGFSGGAILGAALILYLNAFGFEKTERFFVDKTYKVLSVCALGCYCLCKSYSFYTGANDIHSVIPLGEPGAILSSGLILILNICVGIVVSGTMYTFYCMFRKGNY